MDVQGFERLLTCLSNPKLEDYQNAQTCYAGMESADPGFVSRSLVWCIGESASTRSIAIVLLDRFIRNMGSAFAAVGDATFHIGLRTSILDALRQRVVDLKQSIMTASLLGTLARLHVSGGLWPNITAELFGLCGSGIRHVEIAAIEIIALTLENGSFDGVGNAEALMALIGHAFETGDIDRFIHILHVLYALLTLEITSMGVFVSRIPLLVRRFAREARIHDVMSRLCDLVECRPEMMFNAEYVELMFGLVKDEALDEGVRTSALFILDLYVKNLSGEIKEQKLYIPLSNLYASVFSTVESTSDSLALLSDTYGGTCDFALHYYDMLVNSKGTNAVVFDVFGVVFTECACHLGLMPKEDFFQIFSLGFVCPDPNVRVAAFKNLIPLVEYTYENMSEFEFPGFSEMIMNFFVSETVGAVRTQQLAALLSILRTEEDYLESCVAMFLNFVGVILLNRQSDPEHVGYVIECCGEIAWKFRAVSDPCVHTVVGILRNPSAHGGLFLKCLSVVPGLLHAMEVETSRMELGAILIPVLMSDAWEMTWEESEEVDVVISDLGRIPYGRDLLGHYFPQLFQMVWRRASQDFDTTVCAKRDFVHGEFADCRSVASEDGNSVVIVYMDQVRAIKNAMESLLTLSDSNRELAVTDTYLHQILVLIMKRFGDDKWYLTLYDVLGLVKRLLGVLPIPAQMEILGAVARTLDSPNLDNDLLCRMLEVVGMIVDASAIDHSVLDAMLSQIVAVALRSFAKCAEENARGLRLDDVREVWCGSHIEDPVRSCLSVFARRYPGYSDKVQELLMYVIHHYGNSRFGMGLASDYVVFCVQPNAAVMEIMIQFIAAGLERVQAGLVPNLYFLGRLLSSGKCNLGFYETCLGKLRMLSAMPVDDMPDGMKMGIAFAVMMAIVGFYEGKGVDISPSLAWLLELFVSSSPFLPGFLPEAVEGFHFLFTRIAPSLGREHTRVLASAVETTILNRTAVKSVPQHRLRALLEAIYAVIHEGVGAPPIPPK